MFFERAIATIVAVCWRFCTILWILRGCYEVLVPTGGIFNTQETSGKIASYLSFALLEAASFSIWCSTTIVYSNTSNRLPKIVGLTIKTGVGCEADASTSYFWLYIPRSSDEMSVLMNRHVRREECSWVDRVSTVLMSGFCVALRNN